MYSDCPVCGDQRAYSVDVEGPDWDVGAGYTVQGELDQRESCTCQLTEEQLAAEWEVICERACEYPSY